MPQRPTAFGVIPPPPHCDKRAPRCLREFHDLPAYWPNDLGTPTAVKKLKVSSYPRRVYREGEAPNAQAMMIAGKRVYPIGSRSTGSGITEEKVRTADAANLLRRRSMIRTPNHPNLTGFLSAGRKTSGRGAAMRQETLPHSEISGHRARSPAEPHPEFPVCTSLDTTPASAAKPAKWLRRMDRHAVLAHHVRQHYQTLPEYPVGILEPDHLTNTSAKTVRCRG